MRRVRFSTFRYRLWTLFFAVAVFGVAADWLSNKIADAHAQEQAVETIRLAGGDVQYDWQPEMNGVYERPNKYGLRLILGDDFFDRVIGVDFGGQPEPCSVTDDELTTLIDDLMALRYLKVVNVGGAYFSPQTVQQLRDALPNCRVEGTERKNVDCVGSKDFNDADMP